jgi:hypothetical protein
MPKRLAVWLNVDPQREDEFNRWYQDDYIPRFVKQIPGIKHVTRWKVPGTNTYMTMYDLAEDMTQEKLMTALRNPARNAERDEWHQWEVSAHSDFRDGYFEQVFEHKPG